MFEDIIMSVNNVTLFNVIASYLTISIVIVFSCILLFSVLKVLLFHKSKIKDVVKLRVKANMLIISKCISYFK